MLSIGKYIYQHFFQTIDKSEIERRFDETFELAQTIEEEYNKEHFIDATTQDLKDIPTEKCTKSNGKITSLNNEVGMLNGELPFTRHMALNLTLSIGQTVSYLSYQNADGQIKIRKIMEIIEENWNEPVTEEMIEEVRQQRPEVFSTITVTKMGCVVSKRKEFIEVDVDDERLHFSLDEVESTFAPRENDRIALFCEVQRDPKLITEAGPTLEIRKIEPPINRNIVGKITSVEQKSHGVIDGNIFFYWDAVDQDYRDVNKDDRVSASIIECECGEMKYRCLKVVLIEKAPETFMDDSFLIAQRNKEFMNKYGIDVSDGIVIDLNDRDDTKEFTMIVKNASDKEHKVLENVFIGNKSNSQLELLSPGRNAAFFLQPNEEKEYKFRATGKYYGEATEKFYIKFSGPLRPFKIFREIKIFVHDTEQAHNTIGTGFNLHKNRSYTQKMFTRDLTGKIPGVPIKRTANFVMTKFDNYDVPESLKRLLLGPFTTGYINEHLDSILPYLRDSLDVKNYNSVFHTLLHLEECEMFHNMRKYDKTSYFKREREFLSLAVENIAESRPSLVLGDYVIAISPFESSKKGDEVKYEGVIHEVKGDRVLLRFAESFHAKYSNEDYKITFYFSRTPLRKEHHAVELVKKKIPFILFPNKIISNERQVDVNLNLENGELRRDNEIVPWYNSSLNIVQKQAITNILQGVARPLPYVIFGPPGTGKTVTLIETILQIMKHVPHSRVLVATPSNSSANLITERIIDSGVLRQGEFIRLVGENSVRRELIPEHIIRYCGTVEIARENTTKEEIKVSESGLTMNCNAKYLRIRRLLIGTCVTLGTLMQCDIPEDHFTHIIVDESGQCLESQVMIPLSFVDRQIGQIILAGDPMQLGPIVLSRFAAERGLDQSYLVRLLDRIPYRQDVERFVRRFDPRLVTKLVYNYRSLPSIVNVYSKLFYDDDLKAMVNDDDSQESTILKHLAPFLPNHGERNVTQGIIFYGVEGKSESCVDSPSWLNNAEAKHVFQFFIKLIQKGYTSDDIGIITPYTQQVRTIRALLEHTDLVMPKIGTVEEFQGQERQIILLSTVRTMRQQQLQIDEKHSLGFIKSPKRMNVAISRARALLVVFGSPKLLSRDVNWRFLIRHCIENKCAVNCDPALVNIRSDDCEDGEDDH